MNRILKRMFLLIGCAVVLLALAAPIGAVAQQPPGPVDPNRQTAFALNPPLNLEAVAFVLRQLNVVPVEFTNVGAKPGGNATTGLTLDEAIAKYRSQFADLGGQGDPLISGFTLLGSVPSGLLGPLVPNIAERYEIDLRAPEPQPQSEPQPTSLAPSVAANAQLFAPAFGLTETKTLTTGRKVLQDMTWDTQASLDAFGAESYEHDFKLKNSENSPRKSRPACPAGQGENFWAKRTSVTYTHNIPNAANPYLDTDFLDACSDRDFTIGIFHPRQLKPGVVYRTELIADVGSMPSSPYQLTAQMLERLPGCDLSAACVGFNGFDTDPEQLLIGPSKGNTDIQNSDLDCLMWTKGQPSQVCTSPPPSVPGNRQPIVSAGPDAVGLTRLPVILLGSASDPDGDRLFYSWKVSGGPAGALCLFSSNVRPTTTMFCDRPGTYTATLTVDDVITPSVSDSATVTVAGL